MRPCFRKAGLALVAMLGSSSTALAAGDLSAGRTVFAQSPHKTDRQNVIAYLHTLTK